MTGLGAPVSFQYASLSPITSPVAIGNLNPIAIGLSAVRMSMTAFVVRFAFIYNNGILLSGNFWESVLACVTVTFAVTCLCLPAEGNWKRQLAPMHRVCFFVAGVGLMAPSFQLQIAAGVVAAIGVLLVVRENLQ